MTEKEPACSMLCALMELGMERFYQSVAAVEASSGKTIGINVKPEYLWWTIDSKGHMVDPGIVAVFGSKSTKVGLMWSQANMTSALTALVK